MLIICSILIIVFFFSLHFTESFTIQSHHYIYQNMTPDVRITFFVKERGAYICFNQRWQPRLMVGN